MSLDNILITGSSNGLGSHLALFYAKKGHHIILHGRNEGKLKEISESIKKSGFSADYFIADLEKEDEIYKLCDYVSKKNVKFLINNAGMICPNLPFKEFEYKLIDRMILVNLVAPIKITNKLISSLHQIININSMVGIEPKKNRTIYAATKWGLKGFSESLKKEETNIKILDVYPTNIKTWPERENAMEIDFVLNKIYEAMINGETELILDGRK